MGLASEQLAQRTGKASLKMHASSRLPILWVANSQSSGNLESKQAAAMLLPSGTIE